MYKKNLSIVLTLILLVSFVLIGCAKSASEANYAMGAPAFDGAVQEMPAAEAPQSAEGETSTSSYEEIASVDQSFDSGMSDSGKRIVLKDANLTIEVEDPTAAVNMIALMADQRGGFVVSSNVYVSYNYNVNRELPQGYITIRIPAEDLNSALADIKALTEDPVHDVTSENVSGQDVTSQYTDLQSRLRNLEDAQEQMRSFMDDAKTTKDVLAVYAELKGISEEIEVIKGQLKYYDEASAMSAIYVDVQPKYEVPTVDIGGWQPQGVAKKAIQALVNAFQFIVEALIWIVLLVLPVLLMIATPIVIFILILRGIIRRSKKRKAKKQVSTIESSNDEAK